MSYEIGHAAWNNGRIIGQKKPLKPQEVQMIRVALESEGRRRDCAMFELAIDSKLRGCDLVRLKVRDVFSNGRVRDRTAVFQRKTKRSVQFEISPRTRAKLEAWLQVIGTDPEDYLFPGSGLQVIGTDPDDYLFPGSGSSHVCVRQYARFIRKCIELAGLTVLYLAGVRQCRAPTETCDHDQTSC
jgi:integrase